MDTLECCVCSSIADACTNGHSECVRYFLPKTRNVNKLRKKVKQFYERTEYDKYQNHKMTTLLHMACKSGNTLSVHILLSDDRIDPNSPNEKGDGPLSYICRFSNVVVYDPIIRLLLENKKVNIPDTEFANYLHGIDVYPTINISKDTSIGYCSADERNSLFEIRKKKCLSIHKTILLFITKGVPFFQTYDWMDHSILKFMNQNHHKFDDLAVHLTWKWVDKKPSIYDEAVQKNHVLYAFMEHSYIPESEIESFLKGVSAKNTCRLIIELFRCSAMDIKEPDH